MCPSDMPSKTISVSCWLSGAVEGLNPLLKDMSSEDEERVSLAFLPSQPFIMFILHSHLFIGNYHLQTSSTHPHYPIARISPPSPPLPPSLSLSSESSHASSPSFSSTHCSYYHSSGLWWMTEYALGGGGGIEQGNGRESMENRSDIKFCL